MKVKVDNREREWSFAEDCMLDDAISQIETELFKESRRVVHEIKVGEYSPHLESSATSDMVPAADVHSLEVITRSFREYCLDYCDGIEERLLQAQQALPEIIDHFVQNQIEDGMSKLRDMLETLILYYNFLQSVSGGLGVNLRETPCGEGSLADLIDNTNPMLKELESALQNKDLTVINDYLEYEIEPTVKNILEAVGGLKGKIEDAPDV